MNKNDVLTGNYEKVTEDGVVREFYYLNGNVIVVRENEGAFNPYLAFKDDLGSFLAIYDREDEDPVFEADYDAWGQQTVRLNEIGFQRGYTGHEMWNEFGLINMNGRLYDPFIARFLSPDNYVQAPTNSQNFNRYTYCLNNPLKYTDPSGESFTLAAVIVGAVIGTYMGGTIANDSYNPTKWDYSSAQTWRYMTYGGLVGAVSGYMGGVISASGAPFANTMGIACASLYNSIGTNLYTGGKTPISVSFGAVSYDVTNGEWGYLGKKGNSTLENIGYGFGTLANIPDIVSFISGGGENIKINSASTKGEDHDWWGHSSATRENGKTIVSVGPDSRVDKNGSLSQTWRNSIKSAKNWETYLGEKGTWSVELNNISTTVMDNYASKITRWDLLLNSCVGHTTRSLWCAGVPTLYAFHPHMLNFQLVIRQVGIYSSPYLYQFDK